MTERAPRRPPDDGLQPERTALSWSRTSLGVLGNGALLLLRDIHSGPGGWRFVPAGLAAAVALLTYLVGVRRQRELRRRPPPNGASTRRGVRLIGGSVVLLIAVTAVFLPL